MWQLCGFIVCSVFFLLCVHITYQFLHFLQMDSAKKCREEQLRRYYAREKGNEIERERQPVVSVKENAKLRDAAINNSVQELSKILLQKNGKIRQEDINEAFFKACVYGHKEAAHLLLEHNAFVDYQDDDLWTSLHFAAARGDKDLLNLLFEYNVDTTLLDVDGNFALDYALDSSVKQIIAEEMSHSGVYEEDLPSIRTRQLKAMTAAVRSGIARGKDMTLLNKNGVTPLHTAAAYGYYEVTQLLVESGKVPLSILDSFGCTPLDVSMKYGQNQVSKYLHEQGARIEEEGPYEFNTSLNLEALAGRSSPQPLSNKWKLKDITKDDSQREKSWLRQHIGIVQDIPLFPKPTTAQQDVSSEEINPLTNECQTIPSNNTSHIKRNSEPNCNPNPGNPMLPGRRHSHTSGALMSGNSAPGNAANHGGNTITKNPPVLNRKGLAPTVIGNSLQTLPEMIYETRSAITTPTKQQVIEDIYDYGGCPPVQSNNMSIYDDHCINDDDTYDDVQSLMANQTEDVYDDIGSVMMSSGCDQQVPHPYEKFVRVTNKPPPPIHKENNNDYSRLQPETSPTVVYKERRSKSEDDSIPEAWLARMHPQLRRAYVPPPRRDSTPTKAPPPVPPNRMMSTKTRDVPPPPPRNYAPVKNRQLPSHPIDVPSHTSPDYQPPPHLINQQQPLLPPHPPPTHMFTQYQPPTQLIASSRPQSMSYHPPLVRMVSAPPIHSNVPPIHSNVPPIHSNVPPIHSNAPPIHSNAPPIHSNAPPIHSNAPPFIEPPPSYASLLHSPEQFSPPPPPLITPPSRFPQPRPPRYSSEPHVFNATRPNKPVLRKIASTPDSCEASNDCMIVNGINDSALQERKNKSAKPYTFRTKFQ